MGKYLERKHYIIEKYAKDELAWVKNYIEVLNKKWYKVWIVCMTWDFIHPWHIQYIKTIREKIWLDNLKLFVWLEDEERTLRRKWKMPMLQNNLRRYLWNNIKWVDWVFVRNVEEWLHPSDLMLYLQPDFWISHEEYFDTIDKIEKVNKKFEEWTHWKTKFVLIKNADIEKYLWIDLRKTYWLSSTELIWRFIENNLEYVMKKYWNKIFTTLNKNNDQD